MKSLGRNSDYFSHRLNLAQPMTHQMKQGWFAIFATCHPVCLWQEEHTGYISAHFPELM